MSRKRGDLPGRYVNAHIRKRPNRPSEYVDVSAYQEKVEPVPAKLESVPLQGKLDLTQSLSTDGSRRIIGIQGTIICRQCQNDLFILPQIRTSDELVRCKCGNQIGPYLSLVAFADGEAHTPVNADLKPST